MKQYFYFLSFFRLIAAILVLIGHARCQLFATYIDLNPESQNLFTQLFFAGVGWTGEALAIFFVLSGFLVGGPQIQRLYHAVQSGDNREKECKQLLYRFSIGRFTRIIVPLFFAILFVIVVKVVGGQPVDWLDAFLNLLGLQGVLAHDFGWVFWTMAYEIWFYVLLASIICVFCGKKHIIVGVGLFVISTFVFLKLPVAWLFMFFVGIGLYFMRIVVFPKVLIWISLIGLLIVKILATLSLESRVVDLPLQGLLNESMLFLARAICFGIIMTMLANVKPQRKVACWIEHIGNKYGVFTYCLYITHFTTLELFKILFGQLHDVVPSTFLIYIAMCVICSFFGYAFYWIFEHKIGNYLKQKLEYTPC